MTVLKSKNEEDIPHKIKEIQELWSKNTEKDRKPTEDPVIKMLSLKRQYKKILEKLKLKDEEKYGVNP